MRTHTVAVRALMDAEPVATRLVPGERTSNGIWWEGEITAANPVTGYRFCLIGEDDSPFPYGWLNAAGLFPFDVSDSADFRLVLHDPAPAWVDDAVVYQIFPDRFARSAQALADAEGLPTHPDLPGWARPMAWDAEPTVRGEISGQEFYGGDLRGVIERLDHIQSLGANTVYLTPVFPGGSVHRYDGTDFTRIDPLLGGDEALIDLSHALHERGMRLVLDLTTNHTGNTHAWFQAAQADPDAPETAYYLFTDHPDEYESWLNVPSLPKLDHRSEPMRQSLYEGQDSVVAHWLKPPYDADGWRIDVANMTGRSGSVDLAHDVARTLRETMRETDRTTGRETWLIAEHGHDATRDLSGDGWHGTMNYAGFTRPLWAWLADPRSDLNWLGLPMSIPRITGRAAAETLIRYNAEMPWPSRCHSQNQLDSHDTPRIRSVVGDRGRHLVAAAALATLPGVPTLFMGDEIGAVGTTGEHSRTTMPWSVIDGDKVDQAVELDLLAIYRDLFVVRRDHTALRRGGIRFLHISDDALVFERVHPEGSVLVHLARDAHVPIRVPVSALLMTHETLKIDTLVTIGDVSSKANEDELVLTAVDSGSSIIALD
jgi:alpha-glucosidase